ncbi:MAG: hypothetical protein ABSD56_04880 [Bryobacteraceae bacterium]|jgi:hypothetical protein
MSVRTRCGFLLAIAVAGALPAAAQETVLLRLDPPVGQVTRQRLESKMWMRSGTVMPSDTTAPNFSQVMFSTQTVAADEAGIRTITTVIDSSRLEMGPGAPQLGAGADLLKGTRTIQRVNADGDLLSSSTVPGPNAPPMMVGQMGGFGAPPGQQRYPKHPLRVGDTWTDTTTQSGQGRSATTVTTLRVEHIEQSAGSQLATISVKGGSSVPADSAHATSVTGELTGEMVVDVTHRRMVSLMNESRTRIDSPNGPQSSFMRMTITLIEP